MEILGFLKEEKLGCMSLILLKFPQLSLFCLSLLEAIYFLENLLLNQVFNLLKFIKIFFLK